MARFRIIGHRGSGVGAEENTLASYRRAVRDGADAVELDVRHRNGKLVLFHDLSKSRRPEKLAGILAKLDVPVVLHVKRAWFNPWHDRAVLQLLSRVEHRPGVTVSSFWPGTVLHAKRRYPDLRCAFITFWAWWDLRFARRLGVTEFHVWRGSVTKRAIRSARRRSVGLVAFNAPWERQRKGSAAGIQGVITDYVTLYARERSATSRRARRRTSRATSVQPRSR